MSLGDQHIRSHVSFRPTTPTPPESGITTERDVRCHVSAPAQGETPRTGPEEMPIGGWRITPEGLKMNGVLPPTKQETNDYLAHERADLVAQVALLTSERDEAMAEVADLRNAGGPPFIRSEAIRNCREDIAALRAQIARMKTREGELVGALEAAGNNLSAAADAFNKAGNEWMASIYVRYANAARTLLQSVAKEGEKP